MLQDGDGYAAAFDDDYTVEYYTITSGGSDYTLSYKDYGIDFDMEARVGRIPSDSVTEIDDVLSRTMSYENSTVAYATDRKRVYLAMSQWKDESDNSYLGRQIHTDHLAGKGLSVKTLYEPGSYYPQDVDLENEALIDLWTSRGAGMAVWMGHGSSTRTNIRYDDTDLMHTADTGGLDWSPRTFVFQGSCQNGKPETINNLAHELLLDGAMATVAGARNSWFSTSQRDFGTTSTINDIGYWVARNYAKSYRAGYAIKHMRTKVDPWDAAKWMQNALTYNLYGDPTVAWEWP